MLHSQMDFNSKDFYTFYIVFLNKQNKSFEEKDCTYLIKRCLLDYEEIFQEKVLYFDEKSIE